MASWMFVAAAAQVEYGATGLALAASTQWTTSRTTELVTAPNALVTTS